MERKITTGERERERRGDFAPFFTPSQFVFLVVFIMKKNKKLRILHLVAGIVVPSSPLPPPTTINHPSSIHHITYNKHPSPATFFFLFFFCAQLCVFVWRIKRLDSSTKADCLCPNDIESRPDPMWSDSAFHMAQSGQVGWWTNVAVLVVNWIDWPKGNLVAQGP
ncbi:hypothetical protein B0O80DRAFT_141984 [Mortierella sp. GBAus27b]|nr:hypothetical protein B0O80DRAFT_141984 [Mortierella sp. GBAus27b]